jgi:hypothetical protein
MLFKCWQASSQGDTTLPGQWQPENVWPTTALATTEKRPGFENPLAVSCCRVALEVLLLAALVEETSMMDLEELRRCLAWAFCRRSSQAVSKQYKKLSNKERKIKGETETEKSSYSVRIFQSLIYLHLIVNYITAVLFLLLRSIYLRVCLQFLNSQAGINDEPHCGSKGKLGFLHGKL